MQWIDRTNRLTYRRSVKGGHEFMLVDAAAQQKRPAFDHARLATALSSAAKAPTPYTAITLPFTTFSFIENDAAIQFDATGLLWQCTLSDYTCTSHGAPPQRAGRGRGAGGAEPEEELPFEGPWDNDLERMAEAAEIEAQQQRQGAPAADQARRSPDGALDAYVQNFNVYIRPANSRTGEPLSWDGSEGNSYTLQSIVWSPDSKKLVASRVILGYQRFVHYVESSPIDQLQPKSSERFYAKPGDVLDIGSRCSLISPASGRRSSTTRSSPIRTISLMRGGGATAAASPLSTTRGATSCTA